MIATLIRLLIYVSFFFLLRHLIRFLLSNTGVGRTRSRYSRGQTPPGRETRRGLMVKDPVCGIYVDRSLAISQGRGEHTLFFCSKRCLDSYVKDNREKSASRSSVRNAS